jgi:hypothetical protein
MSDRDEIGELPARYRFPDGPTIGAGGLSLDPLVKLDGHWFFKRRTIDPVCCP